MTKNCTTCAHRYGSVEFGVCLTTGYSIKAERKSPRVCGVDFDKWQPREGILRRFVTWINGVKA